MKKTILLILLISLVSCSSENNPIDPTSPTNPTSPTSPTNPIQVIKKPAVINITDKNLTAKGVTSKTTTIRKRLVKTITYTSSTVFDKKYQTKLSEAEYLALPTDNLYDPTEESLNVNTKIYDERTYTYNSSNNLEKITINNIAYPDYNGTLAYSPIVFEYFESGAKVQITKYQDKGAVLRYEYNSIGQIINAKDLDGKLRYTFEYDENNNVISKYLYMSSGVSGVKPHMHYTYVYYPNSTYVKNWIEVNPDGTENKTSSVTYNYDKNIAGVYNNEPVYKVLMDNEQGLSYLHITSNTAGWKPKYFYDSDGYLIKYDSAGQSNANEITLFVYENY